MRVVHFGNLGNQGFLSVKALRSVGVDAHVYARRAEGIESIEWEGEGKPEKFSWVKNWPEANLITRLPRDLEILREIRSYDLIHAHCMTPIYAQFAGRPFVSHAMGSDLRTFSKQGGLKPWLLRRAYTRNKLLYYSSPDLRKHAQAASPESKFIPLPVDAEKMRNTGARRLDASRDAIFFHPASLVWWKKYNDRVVRAFARLLCEGVNALLVLVEWGDDVEKTKALVKSLKIEKNVSFIKPVPRLKMLDFYSATDATVDQFWVGSIGNVSFEAMCCERPVIAGIQESGYVKCYGDVPPVLNAGMGDRAKQEKAIFERMLEACDAKTRKKIGRAGRAWIQKHHKPRSYALELKADYEKILSC